MSEELNAKFYSVYQKELVPVFNAYEIFRKKELIKVNALKFIGSAFLVVAVVGLIFAQISQYFEIYTKDFLEQIGIISMVSLFCSVFILNCSKKVAKNFAKIVKEKCFSKVLSAFGNLSAKPVTFPDSELIKSNLFSSFNIKAFDDTLVGSHDGVEFKVSEVHLQEETRDNDGKKHIHDVFKGIILLFDSNKNFKGQTLISTKGDTTAATFHPVFYFIPIVFVIAGLSIVCAEPTNFGGYVFMIFPVVLFILILKIHKEKKLEKVVLEDVEINKNFDVYSTNQIEARYLITPAFMERFKNLKTAFGNKNLKCSFFDNKILFAISSNEDFFEIANVYTSLHDPKTLKKLYDEISAIHKMIDYFRFADNNRL